MTRLTLSELAEICGADLEGDGNRPILGPASLEDAGPEEISFLAQAAYLPQLAATRAGAVLVGRDFDARRDDLDLLRCDNPGQAFTKVILAFTPLDPAPRPGVHPSACIGDGVELGEGVHVGAMCVIEDGVLVGAGAVVEAHTCIGRNARIGAGTRLHPRVVLYPRVELGERCIVHSGAVLGADGFGFEYNGEGWVKTPQCGNVVIEDDVELGANVTVDCARFGSTRIGRGSKIDNLVHIAHNVQIGRDSVIVAQVGIAGSTRLGRGVILAGQSGLAGHLELGDGARVGAGSRVLKDVPAGEEHIGYPAGPKAEQMRMWRNGRRVGDLMTRVREIERRLEGLAQEPGQ